MADNTIAGLDADGLAPAQGEKALAYWLELPTGRYALHDVKGEEGLSMPFRFELTFPLEPTDPLDPRTLVRCQATLVIERSSELRRITGVLSRLSRTATRRGNAGSGEVEAVFEPRLALLRHRSDIRVFREKTVPEIVEEVLSHLEIPVELRLRSEYKRRDYCVQFRESDFDFVSRLLEDEGIHYSIDERDAVVLGDAAQSYDESLGVLPFRHGAGLDAHEDSVFEVGFRGSMTAGRVSLRDFNPIHPSLDMDVSSEGPTVGGAEWYDYPGEYEEPDEGRTKARLRTEALRCAHHRVAGRSFCAGLYPVCTFVMMGAPAGVADGGYVVTRLSHAWNLRETGFANRFEALPADVVYRPLVTTPAPIETNPLTGFVTGPPGADIHTEEWGRVKVHFPWDRIQPKDDHCSHWVPVLQDNTGHSSSMSRTGWEVLCSFLEGDPDRPVVLGRVYNGEDPFYSPLPERKMRVALRSVSSPRTEGLETPSNFIQFDDFAGAEGIVIHAQKDQNVVVLNDKKEQVDASESLSVKGNETIKVGADQKIQTTGSLFPEVLGNATRTIKGSHKADIGQAAAENIDQNHTMSVGGSHTRTMGNSDTTYVIGNLNETISGVLSEGSAKTNSYIAEKTNNLVVGGALLEISKGNKMDSSGEGKTEMVGALVFSKADKIMATRVEKLRNTWVGGLMSVTSMKSLLVAGLEKLSKKARSASYEGTSEVVLQVKESHIVMKDGVIDLSAPSSISIQTSAKNAQASTTSTQI